MSPPAPSSACAARSASSGLTNSGTVYARGTLNAPVVNNNVFNVTGDLAGTTTFTNNAAAALNVNNGNLCNERPPHQFRHVNVAAGAGLSAGNLNNVSTGTIVNLGTVTDDLNNAGTVMNYGVYNANVASNTGAITNFASGAWNGNAFNTGGTIENDGLWTGSLTNMAGTLTNNAEIVGNVTARGRDREQLRVDQRDHGQRHAAREPGGHERLGRHHRQR